MTDSVPLVAALVNDRTGSTVTVKDTSRVRLPPWANVPVTVTVTVNDVVELTDGAV